MPGLHRIHLRGPWKATLATAPKVDQPAEFTNSVENGVSFDFKLDSNEFTARLTNIIAFEIAQGRWEFSRRFGAPPALPGNAAVRLSVMVECPPQSMALNGEVVAIRRTSRDVAQSTFELQSENIRSLLQPRNLFVLQFDIAKANLANESNAVAVNTCPLHDAWLDFAE